MSENQRGIAHIVLLVVVVAVVLAGAAFFVLKGPSGTSPFSGPGGSTPRVSEDFFSSYIEDPLVRKHYAAQANASTYRIREISSAFETKTVIITAVHVTRDSDINFHKWYEVDGARTRETIEIGNTIYFRDESDGVWWVQALEPEVIEEQRVNYDLEPYDPIEQVDFPKVTHKNLGQEACSSLTCHKYEESLEGLSEAPRYIWFDTSQFLLRHEEVGFGEFRVVNEYFYDGINIVAPSPTKPVPEGRSIYDYIVRAEAEAYPFFEDYEIPEGGFTPEDFGIDPSLYE